MAKSKVLGRGPGKVDFLHGGSGHMVGRTGATPAKPGVTSKQSAGQGAKFASGGTTRMFGRRGAQSRSPGSTGGM